MDIKQVTQVFREQGWQVQPIDENAARFTQWRRISTAVFRRLSIVYSLATIAGLAWFIARYIVQDTTTQPILRDQWQLLLGILALILIISFAYGLLLVFFWREANDEHILIAKQDDGNFRVSRLGKREFIAAINQARALAEQEEGYQRNPLFIRWLLICTLAMVIASVAVLIANAMMIT